MSGFESQYRLSPRDYLAGLDFYTWTRHFHVLHDLVAHEQGEVLEVGTGDGVVRRCVTPFVRRYTVMDINAQLQPDVLADLLDPPAALAGAFDAVVCTEVLEHLPFEKLPVALAHLHGFLRPGGRLYLTLPHRKGHALWVTPRQRLAFLPCMAPFILAFGDLNRYVLRDEPTGDPYQAMVNAHSREDDHHWPWYLEDFSKLGHDSPQAPSDTLRFHYSDSTAVKRRLALRLAPPDGSIAGMMSGLASVDGAWLAPANRPLRGVLALLPPLGAEAWRRLVPARVNLLLNDPRGFLTRSEDTRRRVRRVFEGFLGELFQRGAFDGRDAADAFRIVTDDTVNRPATVDRGQLIVEMRVAPAAAMAFLTVRLVTAGPAGLTVEEA